MTKTSKHPEQVDAVSWWARVRAWVSALTLRDVYFYLGLALIYVGVTGEQGPWRGAWIIGAQLVAVAIFGVARSRGGS